MWTEKARDWASSSLIDRTKSSNSDWGGEAADNSGRAASAVLLNIGPVVLRFVLFLVASQNLSYRTVRRCLTRFFVGASALQRLDRDAAASLSPNATRSVLSERTTPNANPSPQASAKACSPPDISSLHSGACFDFDSEKHAFIVFQHDVDLMLIPIAEVIRRQSQM